MNKICATVAEAVHDIGDGASPAVGGFGLGGVPNVVISALYDWARADCLSSPTTTA